MADRTSRVVMAGAPSNLYSIDPNNLAGGWNVTYDSGKGYSSLLTFFSPVTGGLHGLHYLQKQLNRFVLDLPTSWSLASGQTVVYPNIRSRGRPAVVLVPRSMVNC